MNDFYTPSKGYGELLPAANPLHPTAFEGWFFTFYAGLMVVLIALPWAFLAIKRRKDWLPLIALLSGLVTSLGEPMLDHVGHLRWADTNLPGPAFSNFGLHIPLLIPPCYMLFMGLEAYWIYTMIQKGVTKKQFFLMFAACGLSDAIMEHPGLYMHAYEYYGKQPFEFTKFPFYWSFTNGVAIATIGVLFHYFWPRFKAKGGLWIAAAIPLGIIGTTMGEFGTGFPVFLSINSGWPWGVQWVIGSLTIVLALAWISVLADMVATENHSHDWTFWGIFKSRFMLPHQRERYMQRIAREGAAARAAGGPTIPAEKVPAGDRAGDERVPTRT